MNSLTRVRTNNKLEHIKTVRSERGQKEKKRKKKSRTKDRSVDCYPVYSVFHLPNQKEKDIHKTKQTEIYY